MAIGSISFGGSNEPYRRGLPPQTSAVTSANNPAAYNSNFSTLYPNLSATQGQVSSNTLAHLRGELSPETLNAIQDTAARFGISAGIPLGGGGNTVTGNYGRKLLGQTVEGLQSQGLQDYLNTLKSYSGSLMPTTGESLGAETSRYGTDVGAATSRYGIDTGAQTAASGLGEQAREFDIAHYLQNQQAQGQLGLGYANMGQNYLSSYLNFLH